jgi:predicted N-acyltransferase
MFEIVTHHSIRDIGRETWSALGGAVAPPFLSFEFLDAMESTGAVGAERGWLPLHVVLRRGGVAVAAAPAYVKGNSEGEFVFDHSWAQFAYERLGVPYYPKLLVAAPFTPATATKLLVAPGLDREEIRRTFATGLARACERLGVSGAHVLFSPEEEADAFARSGMVHRFGVQYHWRNQGYGSFDDFLARYPSRRRKRIKRERRALEEQNVAIEVLTGGDLTPEIVDLAFECYLSTIRKYYWGRQYLSRTFFEEVCSTMGDRILVVLARDRGSRKPIAGAFNLLGEDTLYGRYWGAREERPFLHFNVCYYQGIEECIRRELSVFEPGAGGEHKVARGFEPTLTHSTHWLANQRLAAVVDDFVRRERAAVEQHIAEYAEGPVFKADE